MISCTSELPTMAVNSRQAHENGCNVLAFNPQGNLLVTGGNDSMIKVWDVNQAKETSSIKLYNAKTFSSLTFSPQGNMVACAGKDYAINLL